MNLDKKFTLGLLAKPKMVALKVFLAQVGILPGVAYAVGVHCILGPPKFKVVQFFGHQLSTF